MPPPLLLPLLLLLLRLWPAAGVDVKNYGRLFLPHLAAIRSQPQPTREGAKSLFGVRVATVRDGNGSQLLVSDPFAYSAAQGTTAGAVYHCRIGASDLHESAGVEPMCSDSLRFDYSYGDEFKNVQPQEFQFGASLAALPSGEVVACAPGFNYEAVHNLIATPGLCGYWSSLAAKPHWIEKMFEREGLSKHMKADAVCMGASEVQLWRKKNGDVWLGASAPFCNGKRVAFFSKSDNFSAKPAQMNNFQYSRYFGFALVQDSENWLYASSPIVDTKVGGFLFETSPEGAKIEYQSIGEFQKHREQTFGFIGYSMAVLTVSPGVKIAVLGAPFVMNASDLAAVNTGCLYTMTLDNAKIITATLPFICGTEPNGRFGIAVANIGDVNHDGTDDFAVGCPGCGANASGTVSLFFGQKLMRANTMKPFEVLTASELSPQLSGFGWTISSSDIDGNKLPELLISAIGSRHVAVIPSRNLMSVTLGITHTTMGFLRPPVPCGINSMMDMYNGYFTLYFWFAFPDGFKNYAFTFSFQLQEAVDKEQHRRFEFRCMAPYKGWCFPPMEKSRNDAKPWYKAGFTMSSLSNKQQHIPPEVMLKEVKLEVRWRIADRRFTDGRTGQFPAVNFGNRVFETYEGDYVLPIIRLTPCDDCDACDVSLKLLNESFVLLQDHSNALVRVAVKKPRRKFFGGGAIRLNLSPGLHVVETADASTEVDGRYYDDHSEILLSSVFPTGDDYMTMEKSAHKELTIVLRLDSLYSSFDLGLRFINIIAENEEFARYATTDPNRDNNAVHMSMKVNTTLTIQMLRRTQEVTVTDLRKTSSESELLSLSGMVRGSRIGPELRHTYELLAITKPTAPLENIVLRVRLPFLLDNEMQLLYFPRTVLTAAGSRTYELPGLPYISSNFNGSIGADDPVFGACELMDSELAELLQRPGLTLAEDAHAQPPDDDTDVVNRSRRSVDSPPTAPPSLAASSEASVAQASTSTFSESFNCERPDLAPGRLRCVSFRCRLSLLRSEGSVRRAYLHIHPRVWSPTFFSLRMPEFHMTSSVALDWEVTPVFNEAQVMRSTNFTQKFLFLGIQPPKPDFPWGYVVLGIFIGIWLLLLCILLLWYCNFFHRQRPQYAELAQNPPADDDDFYH